MPDETTSAPAGQSQTTPPATQQTQQSTEAQAAKILGKFASHADLEKAYTEAEKRISEYGEKYKGYDEYSKIGPPDKINEALTWARSMRQALESGMLVPANGQKPSSVESAPAEPWLADDWNIRPANEQAAAMSKYVQGEVQKYVDGIAKGYGEQINTGLQRENREKAIMIKAIQAAIKNPNADVQGILEQAAQLSSKSPEDLIDMVMASMSDTPESRQSAINAEVEKRLAERLQEDSAKRFNDITVTPKPKFGRVMKTRQDEDRAIIDNLRKAGIDLLR